MAYRQIVKTSWLPDTVTLADTLSCSDTKTRSAYKSITNTFLQRFHIILMIYNKSQMQLYQNHIYFYLCNMFVFEKHDDNAVFLTWISYVLAEKLFKNITCTEGCWISNYLRYIRENKMFLLSIINVKHLGKRKVGC